MPKCLVISDLAPARREMIAIFSKQYPHWTFLQSSEYTHEQDVFCEHEVEYALIAVESFCPNLLSQLVQLRTVAQDIHIVLFLHHMPTADVKRILNEHEIKVQSYLHLNEGLAIKGLG